MIKIEFAEADKKALNYERYHHPHPRVQRKMEALWLKSQGLKHKEIAQLTGVCVNVITKYIKDYQEGGLEKLKEINFYRPQSELDKQTVTIEKYFQEHPPATLKEAMDVIEKITGIRRSERRIGKFFKRIGLNHRKVGMVPSKANIEEQETFKKKLWTPE